MTDGIVPLSPHANLPDHERRMQDLLGGISNIANSIAEAGGVASTFPFIGINNDGVWCYGQDRTEVEPGSRWAIDIRTWKHGYIAWPTANVKERKPLGERMVPANMALPQLAELPDVGAPYQLQFSFELLCINGEDAGVMALYKNGSYGAKVVVQTLVEEVRKQAKRDPSRLCPVVELGIRDYFHKEWKKTIYNPVLPIQEWITFEAYDDSEKVEMKAAEQPTATKVEPQPQTAPQPQPTAQRSTGPEPMPTGRRRPVRTQPAA
jgi:hypothetical protein